MRFEGANLGAAAPNHRFADRSLCHLYNSVESGEDLGGHVWVDELMRETGGDFLFAKVSICAIAYLKISEFLLGLALGYQKIPLPTRPRGWSQIQGECQSRLHRCTRKVRDSRVW